MHSRSTIRLSILLILGLTACSQQGGGSAERLVDEPGATGSGDTQARSISAEAQAASPDDEMQRVTIMDPAGFGAPMVSATAEIPADWRAQGGVGWDRSSDCVTNHLRMKWLASSPDGRQAFEIMPGMNWQVQGTEMQMNPCPPLPIRSARELLQIVAQRYPDARELEYRDRADLLPKSPPPPMQGIKASSEAGQLVIAYQDGGQEMRALLTTILSISELQGNVVVGAPAVYSQRAPKGQLNGLLGEHIMKSIKTDPQWATTMVQASRAAIERISQRQQNQIATWHAGQMARINAKGAADRSRIAAQTSREVAQIYSDTWNNTQATNDRIQRRTLEAIGSYNTYANPSAGGVVQGSIDYNRVIRTQDGSVIGTNDPNFNPAGSEELRRIP
jgi:hypothetical protein